MTGNIGIGPVDLLAVRQHARPILVKPDHPLIQLEQGFQQMGADESGRARHQPGARRGADALLHLVVSRHPGIVGFRWVVPAQPPWSGWTVAALRSRTSSPSSPSKRSSTLGVECVLPKYSRQRAEARAQYASSVNSRSISPAASSTCSTTRYTGSPPSRAPVSTKATVGTPRAQA